MPLHRLDPSQFPIIQPFYQGKGDQHMYCAGVLSGKYPGKVFVDRPSQPRTAAVFTDGMWCFLGGETDNPDFFAALGRALEQREILDENAWAVLFYVPDESWRSVLDTLVTDRPAIPTDRYLYFCEVGYFNSPPQADDGFTLHFIDESLPALIDGNLPGDVRSVLDLRTASSDPDSVAFGYVVLDGRTCASWSVVDRIVGEDGELGLYTQDPYRKKGLGMVVSGAVLQYGLAHGLRRVHWDVISHNVGSIKMAEKHGLRLVGTYQQNLVAFNVVSHLANLAWKKLDEEEFHFTIEICEKLLKMEKGQMYGHLLTGAARAGLGDKEEAFHHLNKSIDSGWDGLGELESMPALALYKGTPEWDALVARL